MGCEGVADLFAKATRPRAVHQILGACGTGKTTLLAHLAARAARDGLSVASFRADRTSLARGIGAPAQRRWPQLVLVDEADEVSAVALATLRVATCVARGSLVIAAHRDRGWPVLARCHVDADTARAVVDHLLAERAEATESRDELARRLARRGGDLRELLFEMYDDFERRIAG